VTRRKMIPHPERKPRDAPTASRLVREADDPPGSAAADQAELWIKSSAGSKARRPQRRQVEAPVSARFDDLNGGRLCQRHP